MFPTNRNAARLGVALLIAIYMTGPLSRGCLAQRSRVQSTNSPEPKPLELPISVDVRSKYRGVTENKGPIDYYQKWAVVIGIDEYDPQNGEYGPLKFARRDALAMLALLRDEFGFQTSEAGTAIRPKADKARIEAVLKDWPPRDKLTVDDLVVVFYAGHGATDGDLIGCDGKAVPLTEVIELLRDLPCRHKLLILDSCFSGTLFRIQPGEAQVVKRAHTEKSSPEQVQGNPAGAASRPHGSGRGPGDVISTYFNENAFLAISAARTTPAQDGGGDSHSIFTTSLLQTLRERADSTRPDQAFTFRELAARVEARVRDRIGGLQVPDWGRLGPGSGDVVFRPTVWRLTPANGSARRSYAAAIAAAQVALGQNDFARVNELLEDQRPRLGEEDLRGFEWFYLWKLTHPEALLLRGPAEGVVKIAFSPNGHSIIAWYRDCVIREWELPSGRIRSTREIRFDDAPPSATTAKYIISHVGAHPAANIWAVSSSDVGTRLLESGTNRVLRSFFSVSEIADIFPPTEALSLAPVGPLLAWAGTLSDSPDLPGTRQLRIWRGQEQEPILVRSIPATPDAVESPVYPHVAIEFSPAAERLALATEMELSLIDLGVRHWNQKKQIHNARVSALAFTPDGSTLLGGTSTGELWRWKLTEPVSATKLTEGRRWDYSVVRIASDGRMVAAASTEGEIEVRNVKDGHLIAGFPGQMRILHDLQFSPDNELLASCGVDGTVKLWKVRPSSSVTRFDPFPERQGADENPVLETAVEFSPVGSTLATSMFRLNSSRLTRFWDVSRSSPTLLSTIEADPPNSHISGPLFSPSGEVVASIFLKNDPRNGPGIFERSAQIHEVSTGRRIKILDATQIDIEFSAGPSKIIEDLAFTADGRQLFAAERSGVISRWSTDGWHAEPALPGKGSIWSLWVSGNDKKIAVSRNIARFGSTLELAELPDAVRVQTVARLASTPYMCRFSPNGMTLAWSTDDRLLHLYGIEGGGFRITLPPAFRSPASEGPANVLFHPSSQFFVMVTPSLELRGHEIRSGREIAIRQKNVNVPLSGRSVTMDREGRALVSCEGGSIIFLDPATLTERLVLQVPDENFGDATLSTSGTDLAVSARGGKVMVWHAASRQEANDPVNENVTRLQGSGEQVRRYAADVLGGLGRTAAGASPVLVNALNDHSPSVRGAAIEAIVRIGDSNTATASTFTPLLDDPDPIVQQKTVVAFLHLGYAPRQAIDRMHAFLRGRSGELAWLSLQALLRIDSDLDGTVAAVLEGLDSRPEVIGSAIWTSIIASVAGRESRPRDRADRLVPAYAKLLQHAHAPKAEVSLIEGLRRMGSKARSASRAIAGKLSSDEKSVRLQAAITLAEIAPEGPGYQKKMLDVLSEFVDSDFGRENVVKALGDVGPAARDTIPNLKIIENGDEWPTLKHEASFAIRRIEIQGRSRIGCLIELLSDPDPWLKQLALRRLARFGPDAKEAIPDLEQMTKVNDPFAAAARDAVDEIREDDGALK